MPFPRDVVGDIRLADSGALIRVRGEGAKDRRTPAGQALIDAIQAHRDSHAAMDASITSGDSCARVPPPAELTKSRLLDGQTPWGPGYFGAANRTSPSDSSRRERCVLVFGDNDSQLQDGHSGTS